MKKKFFIIYILLFILGLITAIYYSFYATLAAINRDVYPPQFLANIIKNFPQNADSLIDQNKFKENYLKLYYFSWNENVGGKNFITLDEVKTVENYLLKAYAKNPGFAENQHRYSQDWINNIISNVNITSFPNLNINAIITRDTAVRALPTDEPSFGPADKAGEGYPFDNLQITYLALNTPVHILHVTNNGEWVLVITPFQSYGWVKTLDLAKVNNVFAKTFQNANFVVATKDDQPLFDNSMHYYGKTRIGQLYPLIKQESTFDVVMIAIRDSDGNAAIKPVNILLNNVAIWPLKINASNMQNLMQNLLGQKYGWGDLYGYRDCSGTMQALFAPFGIWLPTHSAEQVKIYKTYNLTNLSNKEKLNLIKTKGVPFFTLLATPIHVMLYLGEYDGKVLIFHNPWGIHLKNIFGKAGRIVLGRSLISPLEIGKGYFNVEFNYLDKIDHMEVIN